MNPQPLRGILIGAGYFSDFHLDAWNRIDEAQIIAVCDLDRGKAEAAAQKYSIPHLFTDPHEAIEIGDVDFVDIATPPSSHLKLVQMTLAAGLATICQKPLAPDASTARQILDLAAASDVPFMVHENFRFQPWYREIRKLIEQGVLGDRLHTVSMRTRMGDGWGQDAYLGRQPYFREMPQMLVHETGVHFVDTFRFLAGEIRSVHAVLSRLNPVIRGEDAGLVTFEFESGATGLWDANRYNESLCEDPRYTFGQFCVEGDGGSLWLDEEGQITIKRLGEPPRVHAYHHRRVGFCADCVHAAQLHFIDVLKNRCRCETSASEYAKTLAIVQQIYDSAAAAAPRPTRRIIDLSLAVDETLPAAGVEANKSIENDGWRATTLRLYSHCGTHMDAPCHFLPRGQTIDKLDLQACCGVARIVNLAPVAAQESITVERFKRAVGEDLRPGERLLLRTDWHRRYPAAEYRDRLPRISLELAKFLVQSQVRLIGVEPPSVADVNNLAEVTEVHQVLLGGGVVIVEGLTCLDQIDQPYCEFYALPLKIADGDGCPVRAVAVVPGAEPNAVDTFGFPVGAFP